MNRTKLGKVGGGKVGRQQKREGAQTRNFLRVKQELGQIRVKEVDKGHI